MTLCVNSREGLAWFFGLQVPTQAVGYIPVPPPSPISPFVVENKGIHLTEKELLSHLQKEENDSKNHTHTVVTFTYLESCLRAFGS